MAEIKNYMEVKHDWLRRFLLREPRGHSDMFGAVIFPPKRKECDLGVVFMHNGGYLNMCGHGIIGVITCAVQTGIIEPKTEILVDTPAGIVKSRIQHRKRRVQSVSFQNVPSFKFKTTKIMIKNQTVPVDIAFGGNIFAHVFANRAGISIDGKKRQRSLI